MPDQQVRKDLVAAIADIMMPPFVSFYNGNQALFVATQARHHLDPDTMQRTIDTLFQA